MYEGAYGDWDNDFHIVVLKKLSHQDRLRYVHELVNDNPQLFLEWKSECIRLKQLPSLFGTKENNPYESFVNDKFKKVIVYLQKQGDSFDKVPWDSASHFLEQLFDEKDQLISQEIYEL